jgi:ATP-binding cassette subfamily B multidrug efflux pump
MAFRLNGISHWVMWEMAALFEHIGTVQDGMATLSRTRAVVDNPAPGAAGAARRTALRRRGVRLRRPRKVLDGFR